MAEGQDDARISEIRAQHRGERISTESSAPEYCPHCIVRWPCDYGRLLARLDALTAERDALRGWQDGQTHYVGCWREHRRCALTTIDFEAARRERAELALREAVAELNRLREGQDDERR